MKKYSILFFILILIGIGLYTYTNKEPKLRHIHAGFILFIDGKQKDFSGIDFMSLKPCRDDQNSYTKEEIQDQKAHLHDNVGTIVHSHREGAQWKNLFENMGYDPASSKTLNGYINGKKINNILNYPINDYDSAVFFIGREDAKLLSKALTKNQINEAEKTSRDCGTDDHK
jgi:hypothetical protein